MRPAAWALALALALGACKGPAGAPAAAPGPGAEEAHRDESGEHERLPSRVRLSERVIADAGVKTQVVSARSLPVTVELTGEVSADPDRSARVIAPVAGRVVEVRCKEGDRVAKGALLAVLESTLVARTRAELLSAAARARAAQHNARRLTALQGSGLAAGQEVAAAQAEAQALSAEALGAERALASAGAVADEPRRGAQARLELRAPMAGVVLQRDAVPGQAVEPGHDLIDLADLDGAYFVGRLFEKHIAQVRVGARAEVRLNAYPAEVFTGTVERIGRQLDVAARTVVARIAIRDRGELLKVGLFGQARVTVPEPAGQGPQPPQLVVPLGAVTRIAQDDVVFVRQADGHFEVHPVKLGRTADGLVETLSGLRPGEAVVVEGVFTLKSVVLKGTFGEED